MVDAIIRWSLEQRLLVIAGAIAFAAWGAWETARMPIDVFPDLTAPTVTIIAEAHGMATEEVEALLTFPIETAVNGAAGVRRVRSNTAVGIAVINVDFAWGTDIHRARQVVAERLQRLSAGLPPDIDPPVMGPITSIMGEILYAGLTSTRHTPMELRTAVDWTVGRRLLAVPGVAQVIAIGGDVREYQVKLDPHRLDAFEITADDVAHALETANENTSAGFLVEGGQERLIHGLGRIETLEDVGETLVTMRADLPIQVRDLGEVVIGPALKRGDGGVDGESGVVLGIRKQPQANTLELTQRLAEVLSSLQRELPAGMVVHDHLFRQADFIQVAVDNVSEALRDGAILVVLIVLVFLLSLRATIITALAIPLSLLTAVVAMKLQGVEINTMTLGGMAIAVGALVDDAIIDVENVARRLRLNAALPPGERRPLLEVVFEASREIRRSIVFATVIIVVVFLPLFFLSGVEGRLLRPLGFAYVVSLSASLVVAVTVTPALCSLLLPNSIAVKSHKETAVVRWLKRGYGASLDLVLARWRLLTTVSLLGLAAAGGGLWSAGRSFLPTFDEGALTISIVSLPGTSLTASTQLAQVVEGLLLEHPEVISTARRTGRAEQDEHSQDISASEIEVRLQEGERSSEAFLAAVRADLATVAGANFIIGQPIAHRIDHMLSGARANVAVKIFGPDLQELRRLARQVRDEMAEVPGVVDLAIEQQTDVEQVSVRFDRAAIARHGLTIQQVAHEIETAFLGREVTRVLEGQATFHLVVRYERSTIDTLAAVRSAHIGTPSGARIPLSSLADVQRGVGPNAISRENVERKIVVMCNVAGRDLQAVVDDIAARVDAGVERPTRYRVEYGGQFQSAQQAQRVLLAVGGGVIIAILLLLIVALGSSRDAVLVMVNLPLALIGGVVGVYVAGGVLSVASIIGFITLFGIATRNGIMMVTHFHHLAMVEGERDPWTIVRRGAMERLSPILMTALASGLGLLPLALAGGEAGSEIQTPMAIVILCGLVTSTTLNMVVVPALYLRFGDVTRGLRAARLTPPEVG